MIMIAIHGDEQSTEKWDRWVTKQRSVKDSVGLDGGGKLIIENV